MIKKIEHIKIKRRDVIKNMGLVGGFAVATLLVEGCTTLHKLAKPLTNLIKEREQEKKTPFKFRKITKAIVIARNVLDGRIHVLGKRKISSLNPYYFYGKKWHVLLWERKKERIHYAGLSVTHDMGIAKLFNPRKAGKTPIVLIDNALSSTCPYVVLHEKKGDAWIPYSVGISFMQPPFNITNGKLLNEAMRSYIRILDVRTNEINIKIGDAVIHFYTSKKP